MISNDTTEERRDMHRLRVVCEAVGNGIKIMMDAHQGMDVPAVLKLSNKAAALNIHWFEEQTHRTDFAGHETLPSKTSILPAMYSAVIM